MVYLGVSFDTSGESPPLLQCEECAEELAFVATDVQLSIENSSWCWRLGETGVERGHHGECSGEPTVRPSLHTFELSKVQIAYWKRTVVPEDERQIPVCVGGRCARNRRRSARCAATEQRPTTGRDSEFRIWFLRVGETVSGETIERVLESHGHRARVRWNSRS